MEVVGGYVVKVGGGGMRLFKWGVERGLGSFRNSGRARACLGVVAEGPVSTGVKELPCARFHAFTTRDRMMGREYKAKSVEKRGLWEPSIVRREHASIVKRPWPLCQWSCP